MNTLAAAAHPDRAGPQWAPSSSSQKREEETTPPAPEWGHPRSARCWRSGRWGFGWGRWTRRRTRRCCRRPARGRWRLLGKKYTVFLFLWWLRVYVRATISVLICMCFFTLSRSSVKKSFIFLGELDGYFRDCFLLYSIAQLMSHLSLWLEILSSWLWSPQWLSVVWESSFGYGRDTWPAIQVEINVLDT